MVLGFNRQPVHPTIASHDLRLRIQKHEIKTRNKERKSREKYEKDLLHAQAKHQREMAKIREQEKAKYRNIMERAKA